MPSCALANPDGFLAIVPVDASSCTGYIIMNASEYQYLMSYTEITALEASAAFSGAYSLVFVSGFALTYVVKLATKLINLL